VDSHDGQRHFEGVRQPRISRRLGEYLPEDSATADMQPAIDANADRMSEISPHRPDGSEIRLGKMLSISTYAN
jgi:hypothetical protein